MFRRILTRENMYRSIFLFTIIYFILIYFQKRLLIGIFQTQLPFSIPSAMTILTSDNPVDSFTTRATNGAILTGGFLVIEILFFILLILFFLWKLWQLYKIEQIKRIDYLLIFGLLILLLGSFYYTYILGSTSLETFNTVATALNHLNPKQIHGLTDKWTEFIYNYEFSLGYLPRDIILVRDQINTIIGSVRDIAQLPDVISQYLDRLSVLKFHYFLLTCLGFGILLITQVFEYRLIAKSLKKLKFKRKIDILAENTATTDIQLAELIVQQQLLMTKIVDMQKELQESITELNQKKETPGKKKNPQTKKKKKK